MIRDMYNKFLKSLEWKSYEPEYEEYKPDEVYDDDEFEMWMEVVGVGRFLIEGQVGQLATPKSKNDDFYGQRGIILEDENYILRVMFENTNGRTVKYHEANLEIIKIDKQFFNSDGEKNV
jgi:hypothetical protein